MRNGYVIKMAGVVREVTTPLDLAVAVLLIGLVVVGSGIGLRYVLSYWLPIVFAGREFVVPALPCVVCGYFVARYVPVAVAATWLISSLF